MGLTPLEGLVMGTRGGDLDPGVLFHLHRAAGLGVDELDDLLNRPQPACSGLTGHSDLRDVQAAAAARRRGAPSSRSTVYCHRIRKYVGAYLAALGGADAIVFTAGVGENDAGRPRGALAGLERLGIARRPGAQRRAVPGCAGRLDGRLADCGARGPDQRGAGDRPADRSPWCGRARSSRNAAGGGDGPLAVSGAK